MIEIPSVFYRGAIPGIRHQKIMNFNEGQPLGPGIYCSDLKSTASYYTANGNVLYQMDILSAYCTKPDATINLSAKLDDQSSTATLAVLSVLNKHYDFLEHDSKKTVYELLFDRVDEIEHYNMISYQKHRDQLEGSFFYYIHQVLKGLFTGFKQKQCYKPEIKEVPKENHVVHTLIEEGIWLGYGSLEGTYAYSGRMDAGIQYLIYDENAISDNTVIQI